VLVKLGLLNPCDLGIGLVSVPEDF